MVKFFRKGEVKFIEIKIFLHACNLKNISFLKVGDWKNYLKDNNEWDEWIDAELKGTEIEMEFIA